MAETASLKLVAVRFRTSDATPLRAPKLLVAPTDERAAALESRGLGEALVRFIVRAVTVASLFVAAVGTAADLQVPLDRAGRVQRIDAALAHRIRMFTDRPNFQEARLFQLADSSFVLEISSLSGAGISRERVPLSAASADSLRGVVSAGLVEYRTTPTIDSSGRPLFVSATTLTCFGFYGWAIPYLFEENASSEVQTGTYLVTASAGTFVPLWLTRNRSVSMGSALMSWYGMSRGTLHGALLPLALSDDPGDKAPVAGAFALSIAEGIAGFEWAARTYMTEGSAATITNGADFGVLYGLGFSHLFDADASGGAAGALIGSGVGLAAAAVYAPRRVHTYGDASVMRTAGWVGGYLGLALEQTLGHEDYEYEKSTTAAAMIGATAGLILGDGLVRRTDFTFGQSLVVDLCTIGGGLFGLGIGAFASGDADVQRRVFWSASSLGALGGYAIGYALGVKPARQAAADRSSWRLDVAPSPPLRRGGIPGVSVMFSTVVR